MAITISVVEHDRNHMQISSFYTRTVLQYPFKCYHLFFVRLGTELSHSLVGDSDNDYSSFYEWIGLLDSR